MTWQFAWRGIEFRSGLRLLLGDKRATVRSYDPHPDGSLLGVRFDRDGPHGALSHYGLECQIGPWLDSGYCEVMEACPCCGGDRGYCSCEVVTIAVPGATSDDLGTVTTWDTGDYCKTHRHGVGG